MIEISNMYKQYKMGNIIVTALDNVSLNIEKNEFIAITGPSGSGKSTLMNLLGCLDTPTSGKYILDGMEVSKLNENQLALIRNKKIGFVFQGFNLLPKLTALDNVELPLIYSGLPRKERLSLAMKALEDVGLDNRTRHIPAELSGGQQQRVAIARAIVTNSPVILADEPTGNLDYKSGLEILKLMKDLHSKGNTIIIITHDQNIAMQTERIVSLLDGRIVEDRKLG